MHESFLGDEVVPATLRRGSESCHAVYLWWAGVGVVFGVVQVQVRGVEEEGGLQEGCG